MSLPASKPTRNADYRHAQSLGRQRKASVIATPHEQALAIVDVVRKRIADSQPLPDLNEYNLSDDVWNELCGILTSDELAQVNIAAAGGIIDAYDPVEPQVPEVVHVPSWRDHEPPIVHSLKWRDADGIEHLHVVRADDLEEALRHILKVKLCIKAAQLKAQKSCDSAQTFATDSEPVLSSRRCELHDTPMFKAISKKTGKPYASHMTADGERCFGRKA